MRGPDCQQRPRLWLIAGTGEGPALARVLLEGGWGVHVAVVSASACRAYDAHPGLRLEVGSLAGPAAMAARLRQATQGGQPFVWVVDASHPFASRVSTDLAATCLSLGQPLLRLLRPNLQAKAVDCTLLAGLEELACLDLAGERLLFAIGARHLPKAMALVAPAVSFARLLPNAASLRQARAAGLPEAHLAFHRPGTGAGLAPLALEAALIRQWGITAVLCRQSGGTTEQGWQTLCHRFSLRLLLLKRPEEPEGVERLELPDLMARLGAWG
ncbi:MAG: precorrin-6A/cobalt-precorrin-6A reductase [Cyanobacteria bacterium]|nr:precorrin-6A/cobalt-precorrin-6A reductase [Cyanobacteria bacterium bin.51]